MEEAEQRETRRDTKKTEQIYRSRTRGRKDKVREAEEMQELDIREAIERKRDK